MPPSSLVGVGVVLTPSAGIFSALLWPAVQHRPPSHLAAYAHTPRYGVILPLAPRAPEESYVLAVFFGAVCGAFQSYARDLCAPRTSSPGEDAR